jgi:CBS-domain-containing membrane protein
VGQVAKLVADAMTAEVSSVDTSAPVIEAARLMRSEDVGSVPIVDAGGHVTGIVTDRDIAVRLEGKDPTATGVRLLRALSPWGIPPGSSQGQGPAACAAGPGGESSTPPDGSAG